MDSIIGISAMIQAIATVVLVVFTIIYVKLTSRMLKATNQPEIMVSLRPHEAHVNVVMLWIENVGTGVARNVRFGCNLSHSFDGKTQLNDVGFLKNGIDVLGPGQKIDHFLVSILENPSVLKQAPFKLTVTYSNSSGNQDDEKIFHLHSREYIGSATIGGAPSFEIAKATKEIQKDLHKLTTGSSKPIVRTVPLSEDRLRQRVSVLESRMAQLPRETQQEILQAIESILKNKEREVWQSEETTPDQTPSESIEEG